jgi:hypothetical protein
MLPERQRTSASGKGYDWQQGAEFASHPAVRPSGEALPRELRTFALFVTTVRGMR